MVSLTYDQIKFKLGNYFVSPVVTVVENFLLSVLVFFDVDDANFKLGFDEYLRILKKLMNIKNIEAATQYLLPGPA